VAPFLSQHSYWILQELKGISIEKKESPGKILLALLITEILNNDSKDFSLFSPPF